MASAAVDSLGRGEKNMMVQWVAMPSHPTFAVDAHMSHLITEFAASGRDHTWSTPESTMLFNNSA